ncbi:MAG TPA: hypothetical protein VF857_02175 [Spirochaetota bacterium]
MKIIFIIMTAITFCIKGLAMGADYTLTPTGSESGAHLYELTPNNSSRKAVKRFFVVGDDLPSPRRIVYIFHGYKPAHDPYKQDPSYFIAYWDLSRMSEKYQTVFVLPDNDDSVYPIDTAGDPSSDLAMCVEIEKHTRKIFPSASKPLVIGFSAGVEGAIKFAHLSGISETIAISGNYDLLSLPENEKRFHARIFGESPERWKKENPLLILQDGNPLTLYLLCEEKNQINVKQAARLMREKISSVTIVDLRFLGKGFSHDWTFLSSDGVRSAIETIISGNKEEILLLTKGRTGTEK